MALTGTKALQQWCKNATSGYPGVKVEDMTKSWKDGLAFCAIIHHYKPELIDFSSLNKKNIRENNTLAFEVAERELGIPALLDPEDMVTMTSPDKLSILTYLSQYYNHFKDKKPGGPPPPANPESQMIEEPKDVGVSDKGREFRKRSLKKAKDRENKSADGTLPVKISMKSDKCEICSKRVYLVERQVVDGRLFHRNCFRCTKCKSTLRPDAYKLTKDPKKFECMCHGEGNIWNLRSNISNINRAGARLAGVEEDAGIWQNRVAKPSQPPPEPPVAVKSTTQVAPASPASKPPPIPSNAPIHPHLLKSAARARFNNSNPGSPELQNKQQNGSGLQKGVEVSSSQESLGNGRSDSPARPVPQPRTVVKSQENGDSPNVQSSTDKTTENSSEDPSAKRKLYKVESFMFSTDEDTGASDVRSLQEGESLGFDSSDMDMVQYRDSSSQETEEDTTSADEPASAKDALPTVEEAMDTEETKEVDSTVQRTEQTPEVKEDQNESIVATEQKPSSEEDTLNKVNEVVSKGEEKTELDINTNDVTNKSVEEGSSGDSALWDTKAELSDSFQDEGNDVKKSSEEQSPVDLETSVKIEKTPEPSEKEDNNIEKVSESKEKEEGKPEKTSDVKADQNDNDNYNDDLNPFGSEEEAEEQDKEALVVQEEKEKRQSTNPFGSDDEDEDYDESLNPFGDDDEEEEEAGNESHVSDGSVNPFTGSPIEETPLSMRLKCDSRASSISKKPERPPPPNVSAGTYGVKTRTQILEELKRDRETLKKKRSAPPPPPDGSPGGTKAPPRSRKSRKAPPPPPGGQAKASEGDAGSTPEKKDGLATPTPAPRVVNGEGDANKIEPVPSPRLKKAQKPERPKLAPQSRAHSVGKRKAPAPPPIKREVGKDHMETSVIQKELIDLEGRQRELEEKGIELEKKLRQDDDVAAEDVPHDDGLLTEWFEVVNKKNQLVRREGELIAQAQQQELELQHAEIEYELRVILSKQEHERVDADAQREEQLLELLVEVVSKRNQVVERLEEDRLREEAEDRDIEALMHPAHGDKKKESGKEKKHKKKHKLLHII